MCPRRKREEINTLLIRTFGKLIKLQALWSFAEGLFLFQNYFISKEGFLEYGIEVYTHRLTN